MKSKKTMVILPIIIVMGLFLVFIQVTGAQSNGRSQTIITNVTGMGSANPITNWWQLDSGAFRANYTNSTDSSTYKDTPNVGTHQNPVPQNELVRDRIDLRNYRSPSYLDSNGNRYTRSEVINEFVTNISFRPVTSFKGIEWYHTANDPLQIELVTETGHSYTTDIRRQITGETIHGYPKQMVSYETPIDVNFKAEIHETKEIRVVENSTIAVGESKNLRAQVRTQYNKAVWNNWTDVGARTNETTWTSSNPSVATVSSTGTVIGETIGTTTITARWQQGEWDIESSATVTVTQDATNIEPPVTDETPVEDIGPPVADFTFNPSSPTTFDTIQFTDRSYHPSNVEIVDWQWEIDNQPFSQRNPSYSPREMGGFYATLTVTDKNGLSDSITKPIEVRDPPIAIIDAPTQVKAGELVTIDGRRSYDPWGGSIEEYAWNLPTADRTLIGSNGSVMFMEVGQSLIELRVRNDINLWGNTSHLINVLPPTPKADFLVGGYLKENRKVTIEDRSDTPEGYPIDWSKSYYEITPLDSQNPESIRYYRNLNNELLNVLFKESGKYKVYQYIENTYGLSDESSQIITIAIDQKPIADYATPNTIYRDPNNNNLATIELRDNSRSLDEDIIQQRIWMYRYDQENQYRDQKSFESEEWIIIDESNKFSLTLNVKDVGYYEIKLVVKEDFGQPTILDFINDNDYRRGESLSKIIKVDNYAPSIDWVTN